MPGDVAAIFQVDYERLVQEGVLVRVDSTDGSPPTYRRAEGARTTVQYTIGGGALLDPNAAPAEPGNQG